MTRSPGRLATTCEAVKAAGGGDTLRGGDGQDRLYGDAIEA